MLDGIVLANINSKYISETIGVESKRGNLINSQGKVLGQHKGIINYTIG